MAMKPVIVGTDGSQESLRAAEWAAREAALRGAPLRILAIPVLPPRMTPNPATPDTVAGLIEHSTSRALAAAAQQAAALEPDLAIETQLLEGRRPTSWSRPARMPRCWSWVPGGLAASAR